MFAHTISHSRAISLPQSLRTGVWTAILLSTSWGQAAPAVSRGAVATQRPAAAAAIPTQPAALAAPQVQQAQRAVHQVPANAVATPQIAQVSHTMCDDACATAGDTFMPASACSQMACSPLWGGVEYLLWWEKQSDHPPLVTTSPANTAQDRAGVAGLNTTTHLLGGDAGFDNSSLDGIRVSLGIWLDPCQSIGLGGRWFGLAEQEHSFRANSDNFPILGRPFFDATTDEETALLQGFPGLITGDVAVDYTTKTQGGDVFLRQLRRTGSNYRMDLIYGYRFLSMQESLQINSFTEIVATGATIDGTDRFRVKNEFNGGELGLMGHSVDGRWMLDVLTTVALGNMSKTATINGSATSVVAGQTSTTSGSLLTQPTNIGTFKDNSFSVIPEVNLTLSYVMTSNLNLSVGYSFLYVSNLTRTEDLIDRRVNLTQQTGQLFGDAVPAVTFNDNSYWLQGLSFGVQLLY